MTTRRSLFKTLAAAATAGSPSGRPAAAALAGAPLAGKPPMGWNSFDAYDCNINKKQFRAVVDYMAAELRPLGWVYGVIDYISFNPAPGNWNNPKRRFGHPDLRLDADGRPVEKLVMDDAGRLLPAVERFPSAAGGRGFRPIADYAHEKGLKFGIRIMRGIPRQAYFEKRPIQGTKLTAADIADPLDTCNWCNNMFGVDPRGAARRSITTPSSSCMPNGTWTSSNWTTCCPRVPQG
jgi:alpha-galactosidase